MKGSTLEPRGVNAKALRIGLPGDESVSALLIAPSGASIGYVFAHGAGAGMDHTFMASLAGLLGEQGVATLRFQFPYLERGSKRVDSPAVAKAAVRAAVTEAGRLLPDVTLFAGGKSFGGRMTSQAQAETPLPGVAGLAFVGFPLHPAGKPGVERAEHLAAVKCPMLFLQGTRDELADTSLLRQVVGPLGDRATTKLFDDADHSFHVRKKSGSTDETVLLQLAMEMTTWFRTVGAEVG